MIILIGTGWVVVAAFLLCRLFCILFVNNPCWTVVCVWPVCVPGGSGSGYAVGGGGGDAFVVAAVVAGRVLSQQAMCSLMWA